LVAALAFVVAGCGGSGDTGTTVTGTPTGTPTGGTTTTVTTNAVAISGFAFFPPNIQVSPGAVVTWSNGDATDHNVTFTSGSTATTGNFSSGSKSLTMPTTPGTYAYHCTIHGTMTGTVVVQ
jgi:plastocyanin